MNEPASVDEVKQALQKSFAGAELIRMPRHPRRRDILLATMASGFERRYAYSESELNERLQEVLATVNALVDYATCRRYMVDCGFLKRDRAGTRYFLNYPKLEETLSTEALRQSSGLVDEVLRMQLERIARNKVKRT